MISRRKLIEDLAFGSDKVLPSDSDYGKKICNVVLSHYNIEAQNLAHPSDFEEKMKDLGYKINSRYREVGSSVKKIFNRKNKVRHF